MKLERLPVELISQICSILCLHCHAPHVFPHADTEEARAGKRALSRLSRMSQRMRAIAQPFVFHYYASSNMPVMLAPINLVTEQNSAATTVLRPGNDRLPFFLGSILSRPDLASRVRALQLFWPNSEAVHQNPDALLKQAADRLGLDLGFEAGLMTQRHAKCAHHCLRHVAILLCPNVSKLLLPGDFFSSFGGSICPKSGRTLPSLQTVGLVPAHGVTLGGVDRFLSACAPNVESLHVARLASTNFPYVGMSDPRPRWGVTTLRNIRRLVVNNIGPRGLLFMMHSCPQISDLQYTHHGLSRANLHSSGSIEQCRLVMQAIGPLHKTLRRLSLVVMHNGDPRGTLLDHPAIDSLRHFEKLETLAINQAHIYPYSSTPPPRGRGLLDLLPRSIRDVQFLHVCRDFGNDLEVLVREAPKELPHLQSLRVSLYPLGEADADPEDMFPLDPDWVESMEGHCEAAGISWGWERGSPVGFCGGDSFPGETILWPS
ncbi:hypothetical protein C8A00DRAFT_31127 [Chaetomidium leptoderma]|uniref:Uncharacterized protein n=1 Tax=Chaetomidium leptoderma TaxID=669021 RepID=A0AAN6VTC1_9PEZI|nr:hypothetical protein C8A00DRAFT_31127 [Chaetomidium leptoderma]